MALLTIFIDDLTPTSGTTVMIRFRWCASDGTNFANDSGEQEYSTGLLSSVLNQNLISYCSNAATAAGVTIGGLDKKLLSSGLL